MSDDDSLLDQADALMRRHRVYVAGAASTAPEPALVDESDDLPLLTDIVAAEPPTETAGADIDLERRLAEHHAALVLELETWLDEQLPQLVIRAMDGITDHLVTQITRRAQEQLLPRLDVMLKSAPEDCDESSG
ncbi:MAG TPA: hypothetical protein VMV33_10765 [Rhodocyclaceae bacterium]|nr:hypothetical protein [Rhodocyclaceae bacterium]